MTPAAIPRPRFAGVRRVEFLTPAMPREKIKAVFDALT